MPPKAFQTIADVRSSFNFGRKNRSSGCPLSAKTGLMHCSKNQPFCMSFGYYTLSLVTNHAQQLNRTVRLSHVLAGARDPLLDFN